MPDDRSERGKMPWFVGRLQAADKWCWAAAAASVHATYSAMLSAQGKGAMVPAWTQCSIVDENLIGPGKACSGGPGNGACDLVEEPGKVAPCVINPNMDREGFLYIALRKLGLLEGYVVLGSGKSLPVAGVTTAEGDPLVASDALDFDEIKALVDNDRLVCLRIVRGDIRHFVIIYGYEAYPDNDLLIWNPAIGPEVVDFDGFWREFGPFTHKIITRPPS